MVFLIEKSNIPILVSLYGSLLVLVDSKAIDQWPDAKKWSILGESTTLVPDAKNGQSLYASISRLVLVEP